MRGTLRKYQGLKMVKFPLLLIVVYILSGCLATRTLDENEYLYKKSEISFEEDKHVNKLSRKNDLKNYVSPSPNKRVFGLIPFKLYLYNLAGKDTADGAIGKWLQNKVGESPVVFETRFAQNSELNIKNRMYNIGYFDADVTYTTDTTRKKITVEYIVTPRVPYTYDSIIFPRITDSVTKVINNNLDESLLKRGDQYNLETLKKERERLNTVLLNEGYYFFSKEYLKYQLDSNQNDHSLIVYLKVKENTPKKAFDVYKIDEVKVFSDYSIDDTNTVKDTTIYNGVTYLNNTKTIKYHILDRSILLKKPEIYSYSNYTGTLNKLLGLGVYKFVNVKFIEDTLQSPDSSFLNTEIFLTPQIPKSFRLQLQASSKSNDLLGPTLSFNYRDRNLGNAAAMFLINSSSGFETQLNDSKNFIYSYELGFDASVTFPTFVMPFVNLNKYLSKQYTPKTTVRTNYSFFDRYEFFTLNRINLTYEYIWRETRTKSHNLELFSLDYSNLSNISSEFSTILETDTFVYQSFEEQFIFSLKYSYLFNNQMEKSKKINTYFNFGVESAGSSIRLFNNLFTGGKVSDRTNEEFLGLPYSQFIRGNIDVRFYINLRNENQLASRLFAGAGVPFGNSEVLPYVKQFSAGGARSLRGFNYRSVGPGSYPPPDTLDYFDQTGNIKLEANLEYRFTIVSILKGALFADAGNVWLIDEKQKPGAEFKFSQFYRELAFNTGFGLRLDVNFFVLRFDFGIPLRVPYYEEGSRWIFEQENLGVFEYLGKNMVLNISVGYPF